MRKSKVYPNYTNIYIYEGGNIIYLERWSGGKKVYSRPMSFTSSMDASIYFELECGE